MFVSWINFNSTHLSFTNPRVEAEETKVSTAFSQFVSNYDPESEFCTPEREKNNFQQAGGNNIHPKNTFVQVVTFSFAFERNKEDLQAVIKKVVLYSEPRPNSLKLNEA